MQSVEDVNDNNNCYGNEEIETLHNSVQQPPDDKETWQRVTSTKRTCIKRLHVRYWEREWKTFTSRLDSIRTHMKSRISNMSYDTFLGNLKSGKIKIRLHPIERNRSKWASWCNGLHWTYDRRNE